MLTPTPFLSRLHTAWLVIQYSLLLLLLLASLAGLLVYLAYLCAGLCAYGLMGSVERELLKRESECMWRRCRGRRGRDVEGLVGDEREGLVTEQGKPMGAGVGSLVVESRGYGTCSSWLERRGEVREGGRGGGVDVALCSGLGLRGWRRVGIWDLGKCFFGAIASRSWRFSSIDARENWYLDSWSQWFGIGQTKLMRKILALARLRFSNLLKLLDFKRSFFERISNWHWDSSIADPLCDQETLHEYSTPPRSTASTHLL